MKLDTAEVSGKAVTTKELSMAANYLTTSRDGLLKATEGLTETQLTFKSGPNRWSITDVVEHLVMFEDFVHFLLGQMKDGAIPEAPENATERDKFVLSVIPDRSKPLVTVPQGTPSGQWSPAETLSRFRSSRERTLKLLQENCNLRRHSLQNPLYEPQCGPWDGFQWILALAMHTSRHTKQIEEVRKLALASA